MWMGRGAGAGRVARKRAASALARVGQQHLGQGSESRSIKVAAATPPLHQRWVCSLHPTNPQAQWVVESAQSRCVVIAGGDPIGGGSTAAVGRLSFNKFNPETEKLQQVWRRSGGPASKPPKVAACPASQVPTGLLPASAAAGGLHTASCCSCCCTEQPSSSTAQPCSLHSCVQPFWDRGASPRTVYLHGERRRLRAAPPLATVRPLCRRRRRGRSGCGLHG